MKYYRLSLCVLTKEQHLRTCGYWFVVQEWHGPHTAFATKQGLERWLVERGLRLTELLTEAGTNSYQKIAGQYETRMHLYPAEVTEWFKLQPVITTRTLSNGDWVEAKIAERDGIRTVHTLNPNVHNRHVYDYQESKALMS